MLEFYLTCILQFTRKCCKISFNSWKKLFLVAVIRGFVRLSFGPSIGHSWVIGLKSGTTSILDIFVFVWVWGWVGVWIGVGCPCPPVRNDILTPHHLFNSMTFGITRARSRGPRERWAQVFHGCGIRKIFCSVTWFVAYPGWVGRRSMADPSYYRECRWALLGILLLSSHEWV